MTSLRLLLCILIVSAIPGCTQSSKTESQPSLARSGAPTRQPSTPDRSDAGADALALIERVIAAHGGRENIRKARIGQSKLVITGMQGLPAGSTAEVKEFFDLPSRFRRDVTASAAGESFDLSYVITEHGSWQRFGDLDWMPNPQALGHTPVIFPSGNFDTLLLLAESPGVVTVSSARTSHAKKLFVLSYDVRGDLRIDSESHLMYSSNRPSYSLAASNFVETNTFYKDYKTIEGVVVPMTTEAFQNGKLVLRHVVKEIKFLDRQDESIFALD